jgi:hypothetical protein
MESMEYLDPHKESRSHFFKFIFHSLKFKEMLKLLLYLLQNTYKQT